MFILGWKEQRDNLISIEQKKRILEFASILRSKFEQHSFNEPMIVFQILRYIFDFHPDNKRMYLKRKLIN